MKKGVSIIIPTFQVPEYLSECINSILSQNVDFNYEIIIGVDGCESTLNHINKNSDLFKKTKPYYFEDNLGPFVIKNNLIGKTKYQYILFFDSDDLMKDGMLQNFYNEIIDVDIIRFKYVELVNGTPKGGMKLAHGVLGVNRKIFEKVIGYENWRCAADTEFLERMSFNNFTTKTIENTSFFRRLHSKNLTIDSKTNYSSELRNEYVTILNKKRFTNTWDNPIQLIKEFKKIKF